MNKRNIVIVFLLMVLINLQIQSGGPKQEDEYVTKVKKLNVAINNKDYSLVNEMLKYKGFHYLTNISSIPELYPPFTAVLNNDVELLKLLIINRFPCDRSVWIGHGPSPEDTITPWGLALKENKIEIIDTFLKYGIYPRDYIIKYITHSSIEGLQRIISKGIDISSYRIWNSLDP